MSLTRNICRTLCVFHKKYICVRVRCSLPLRSSFGGVGESGNNFQNVRQYSKVGLARASAQLKRQPLKKKLADQDAEALQISAFSTAEEFELESLTSRLKQTTLYKYTDFNKELVDSDNVVHFMPQQCSGTEPQDVFVFREGSVVLWNFNEAEMSEILDFLKAFYKGSGVGKIVESETEFMPYTRSNESSKTIVRGGKVVLSSSENETLEKFAISNAMALSVHLGAYESLLNDYIDSMLPVTEDLKSGRSIKMSKKDVLRKMGQLFALRHVINLSSDLLDTPDFYWDREELEKLYQRTFNYFCITRRTKVMNEKINHCIELVELLQTQLSDAHHIRLEWMIIVLIMVEVCFEGFHYAIKY